MSDQSAESELQGRVQKAESMDADTGLAVIWILALQLLDVFRQVLGFWVLGYSNSDVLLSFS